MNLLSRIFTYLIGITIGTILVYFMLFRGRDRDLGAWMPNARVISQIQDTILTSTSLGACKLQCLGITEEEMKGFLDGANVRFGKSETKAKPCPVYHIETSINNFPAILLIEVCEDGSVIRDAEVQGVSCECR